MGKLYTILNLDYNVLSSVERSVGDRLEIPDGVEMVAPKVMGLCDGLREVVFPGSVRYIGGLSFESCKSLRHVEFSGPGLAGIGDGAFRECSLLEEIVIPEGCVSIGKEAFVNCLKLKRVVLPSTLRYMGSSAFCGCEQVREIKIPGGIISISDYVFKWCTKLRQVEIGEGIVLVGVEAFMFCGGLRAVTLPGTCRYIGAQAFSFCDRLRTVSVASGGVHMEDSVFLCSTTRGVKVKHRSCGAYTGDDFSSSGILGSSGGSSSFSEEYSDVFLNAPIEEGSAPSEDRYLPSEMYNHEGDY